ncbi:MAG: hypothetical protein M3066_04045 [Actinomycetota bacterium]|nr:hypothetical protein [Actinomycetota bacterium]
MPIAPVRTCPVLPGIDLHVDAQPVERRGLDHGDRRREVGSMGEAVIEGPPLGAGKVRTHVGSDQLRVQAAPEIGPPLGALSAELDGAISDLGLPAPPPAASTAVGDRVSA